VVTDGSSGVAIDFIEWLRTVAPSVPVPTPTHLDRIVMAIETERPLTVLLQSRTTRGRVYLTLVQQYIQELQKRNGPTQCSKCKGFISWDDDILGLSEPYCVNCGWRPTRATPPANEEVISTQRKERRVPDLSGFFYPIVPDTVCFFIYRKGEKSTRCALTASYQVNIEVPSNTATTTVSLCEQHLRYWERRARVTIIQEYA